MRASTRGPGEAGAVLDETARDVADKVPDMIERRVRPF
jgi:hypothetical protein